MTQVLNEKSLRPGVLRDLIHPIISIDEFTPKINPNNIVIQFQVLDNYDAAYDLSSFLERSPEGIIDTEASETPNIDGRYNVFVEMERTTDFPDKLVRILSDLENLSPNTDWKLQLYKVNDPIDVDVKKITKDMILSTPEEITEFFDNAPVNVILDENRKTTIKTIYGETLVYDKISNIMNESQAKDFLKDNFKLDNTSLSMSLSTNYTVLRIDEGFIVGNGDKFVILK